MTEFEQTLVRYREQYLRIRAHCILSGESIVNRLCRLKEFEHITWYWGSIPHKRAERKLRGKPDFTFLVRDSEYRDDMVTISVVTGGTILHEDYRIELLHSLGIFTLRDVYPTYPPPPPNAMKFVEAGVIASLENYLHTKSPRVIGHHVVWPSLKYPLSRNFTVFSLRHICRFEIRAVLDIPDIWELPIADQLKKFLSENSIFTETSDNEEENQRY